MTAVRTAVVSDLHIGKRAGNDLVTRTAARRALFEGLAGADQVVLLGDVLELRDLPVADVLERAHPFLEELGDAVDGARVVVVPGNHDHQLAAEWLERRRRSRRPRALALEQVARPGRSDLLGRVAARLPRSEVVLAYPGLWVRDDVYATHGHYLDRHNTVPSFEVLAAAGTARITGRTRAAGESPVADYEAALAPLYAFAYALAQGMRPGDPSAGGLSLRVWERLNRRAGRFDPLRLLLAGAVLPTAVGALNLTGLGRFRADLSGAELCRASLRGMRTVVERLGVEASHVLFGHTHRSGPHAGEGDEWTLASGTRLVNTGSWVHEPAFIGDRGRASPHWPGTCVTVEEDGPPLLRRLLEHLPGMP